MRQDIRGRRKSESRNTRKTTETFFMNENDNESFNKRLQRYAIGLEYERSKQVYWLSNKERRVDALALRADERRDKLRKASGSCK